MTQIRHRLHRALSILCKTRTESSIACGAAILITGLSILAAAPAAIAAGSSLQSPFPRIQPVAPSAAASFTCPAVPPATRNITANRYYNDAASSVIDPVLKQQNDLAVKPLDDFLRDFSRMTDLYVRSGSEPVAACALDWVHAWAQGDAMLGTMSSNQAEYQHVCFRPTIHSNATAI